MTSLRSLQPGTDVAGVQAVWDAAFAGTWPIDPAQLARRVRAGVVALDGGEIIGFALVQKEPRAAILAMAVQPDRQRQGIGGALLAEAVNGLEGAPSPHIRLGGGTEYFWAGVPCNLSGAISFFQRRGWQFTERSWDMTMDLRGYTVPREEQRRLGRQEMTCRLASDDDRDAILAFEEAHFPGWTYYFRIARPDDIVLAVHADGRIAGALVLDPPRDGPILWSPLLGSRAAEIGAVGVDPALHGRGIGSALVAYTCAHLTERDLSPALLRWLARVNFYGRLGFTSWREYAESTRPLADLGA